MVTPLLAAAVVAALLVECALNIDVSMPAFARVVFSHLAIVDEATGLCGLIVDKNTWWGFCSCPLPVLKGAVLFRYSVSDFTGHSLLLS